MFHNLDRRRTLLIVDDSPTDIDRARRVLCDHYDIEIMSDGASALERLSSGPIPDLMLIDWVMPGISGVEVCQFVRAAGGKLSTVPIVLLTARHGSEEIIHALRSGANDYVSKPFVDEELKARVKNLMASKALLERAENAETDVRTLLMNTPDPIFAVNNAGAMTFANEAASQLLAQNQDNALAETFAGLLESLNYSKANLLPLSSVPVTDIRIAGRVFSPSFRILPSDTSASTTIALRDVTDRRRDEARRLDFYSIIAHDLRTPITSILMRVQLASRGRHGVLSPGMLDDMQKIEASLRSQVGMINDFLELAKLEGVGYRLDRKPVDISELIANTVDDFQPLLEKNNISWKHEAPTEKVLVLADRQRLSQVLANLIGNAIKFTPESGTITTAVADISDRKVEISVTDTGRGIAEDELEHIFQRFTRARESQNETIGTGLGLMIVREVIEAHGGELGVSSQLGVGSRFWFRLSKHIV